MHSALKHSLCVLCQIHEKVLIHTPESDPTAHAQEGVSAGFRLTQPPSDPSIHPLSPARDAVTLAFFAFSLVHREHLQYASHMHSLQSSKKKFCKQNTKTSLNPQPGSKVDTQESLAPCPQVSRGAYLPVRPKRLITTIGLTLHNHHCPRPRGLYGRATCGRGARLGRLALSRSLTVSASTHHRGSTWDSQPSDWRWPDSPSLCWRVGQAAEAWGPAAAGGMCGLPRGGCCLG